MTFATLPESVCVDANVFIAAFGPQEAFHEEASEFLVWMKERQVFFFEPDVVIFEVSSVLHRKALEEAGSSSETRQLLRLFFGLPLLLQWQEDIFLKAIAHAKKASSRSISDSLYLAVAESRGIPLVTLDDQLLRRGRASYRKVMTPRTFLDGFLPR